MQALSRLNRAHPGKDTTYVLDFVNDTQEILEAFQTHHTTAELADVTDRAVILNLRGKLDGAGHYDNAEADAVVAAEFNPNPKQSELVAAVEPDGTSPLAEACLDAAPEVITYLLQLGADPSIRGYWDDHPSEWGDAWDYAEFRGNLWSATRATPEANHGLQHLQSASCRTPPAPAGRVPLPRKPALLHSPEDPLVNIDRHLLGEEGGHVRERSTPHPPAGLFSVGCEVEMNGTSYPDSSRSSSTSTKRFLAARSTL